MLTLHPSDWYPLLPLPPDILNHLPNLRSKHLPESITSNEGVGLSAVNGVVGELLQEQVATGLKDLYVGEVLAFADGKGEGVFAEVMEVLQYFNFLQISFSIKILSNINRFIP